MTLADYWKAVKHAKDLHDVPVSTIRRVFKDIRTKGWGKTVRAKKKQFSNFIKVANRTAVPLKERDEEEDEGNTPDILEAMEFEHGEDFSDGVLHGKNARMGKNRSKKAKSKKTRNRAPAPRGRVGHRDRGRKSRTPDYQRPDGRWQRRDSLGRFAGLARRLKPKKVSRVH